MRVIAAMFVCCIVPAAAAAQSAAPQLPKNDLSLSIGWAGSDFQLTRYDSWRGSVLVGAGAGHYWTDHLKTEVEFGWFDPGRDEIYENLDYLGTSTYAVADHTARDLRLGAVQIYQFGRNAWVHPYAGVGFDVIHRDVRIERDRQSRSVFLPPNRTIPVQIPPLSEHRTDVFAQGILKTGLKLYATERAFFNTEMKLGIRRDVDHVVWKVGLGFDF
jgi:opacity protein-like surface antigen